MNATQQLTKKIKRFQKIVQLILGANDKQSERVLGWAIEFDSLKADFITEQCWEAVCGSVNLNSNVNAGDMLA